MYQYKIINDEIKCYIKEMLMDEVDTKYIKRTARNMLKRGESPEDIVEVLEVSTETVKAWEKEFYTVV